MDIGEILLANGSVRIKRTRHGLMAYNINDLFVGRSLDCYGEYSRGEVQLFPQLASSGAWVLDVGANIGALTLSLAQTVGPSGTVVAIEPQRAIYQLLCTNLALNEVNNVHPILAAAGQTAGRTFVPVSDYSKPGNFGGTELTDKGGESVVVLSIDSLQLPACQFIKIDVEGQTGGDYRRSGNDRALSARTLRGERPPPPIARSDPPNSESRLCRILASAAALQPREFLSQYNERFFQNCLDRHAVPAAQRYAESRRHEAGYRSGRLAVSKLDGVDGAPITASTAERDPADGGRRGRS
jgi:FkbM family methyltransferase